ncbi:RNase A-like domain-containing protein [Myceligenerans pegani]|uniref:Bacterial CdiA-CT RNAse A domain-containing protein n=1 Tax=Myceligenerans pegani TaxID=2776917 RepID=A0ABR9MVK6_9MICO|nr:RNase A-like domain-containing protein [Myceligenerans sp. TRM 65318]MBE1874792.1 hypothetical protein [Myceligenerans sp. TRM 65318]MBE3017063.1 hypothetical protein [Myceligenerans sp. TRM 65318]
MHAYHIGDHDVLVHNDSCPLAPHEAAGGHAISRHVGMTDAQLKARDIPLSSTFTDLAAAEKVTGGNLATNRLKIRHWLAEGTKQRVEITGTMNPLDGRVYLRSSGSLVRPDAVTTVLQRNPSMPDGYHIVTSFPTIAGG